MTPTGQILGGLWGVIFFLVMILRKVIVDIIGPLNLPIVIAFLCFLLVISVAFIVWGTISWSRLFDEQSWKLTDQGFRVEWFANRQELAWSDLNEIYWAGECICLVKGNDIWFLPKAEFGESQRRHIEVLLKQQI